MKNSAWYNKLWQNKMQELPLEGDADLLWQKMQGLLDENMPTEHLTGARPIREIGIKLIKLLAVIVTAAVLYYGVTYLLTSSGKNNKKSDKHINKSDSIRQNKAAIKDSLNTTSAVNSTESSSSGGNSNSLNNKTSLKRGGTINIDPAILSSNKTKPQAGLINGKSQLGSSINSSTVLHTGANRHAYLKGNNGKNLKPGSAYSRNKYGSSLNNNALKGKRGRYANSKVNSDSYLSSRYSKEQAFQSNAAGMPNQPIDSNRETSNLSDTTINQVLAKTNGDSLSGVAKVDFNENVAKKNDATTEVNNKTSGATRQATKGASANAKAQPNAKTNRDRKATNSKLALSIKAGLNINGSAGGGTSPVFGVAGAYYLTPKWSFGIGANALQRTISGSYSNSNYKYTAIIDTNKQVTRIADKITVNSTLKVYNLDIPLFAGYRASKWLSFTGGPLISIPLHSGKVGNTLSPISNPVDTAKAYKTIASDANGTTISDKINFSLFGGVKLNFNRFFIEGNYVWGLSPYTISSPLGTDKVYCRSYQFSIGFNLFKPKP